MTRDFAAASNRPALVTAHSLAIDFKHLDAEIIGIEAQVREAPVVVEDDEDLAAITALVKVARDEGKRIDDIGGETTKPYYDAHKTGVAFFKQLSARLSALEFARDAYLAKKRDAERKRQAQTEHDARVAAEAAQCVAIALQQENKPELARATMATATEHHDRADKAAFAASAPAPDLTRTQTAAGTASLSDVLTHEITDWNKIDWSVVGPYIRRDDADAAIRALMRAKKEQVKDGTLTIAGVTFKRGARGNYR